MMNKTLLSLGLATALVVPAGAAVAAAEEVNDPTPTTVIAEQDRDQVRTCGRHDGEAAQIQDRDRLRDPASGDGYRDCDGYRNGDGYRDCDGNRNGPADTNGLRFGR